MAKEVESHICKGEVTPLCWKKKDVHLIIYFLNFPNVKSDSSISRFITPEIEKKTFSYRETHNIFIHLPTDS